MKRHYVRLVPYAIRQWPALSMIAALTILGSLLTAFQPWPLKVLVDCGLKNLPAPQTLQALLASTGLPSSPAVWILLSAVASIALFAINSALDAGLTLLWAVGGQRMVFDL